MALEIGDGYGGGIIVEIVNNRALIVSYGDFDSERWEDAIDVASSFSTTWNSVTQNDWVLPSKATYQKIYNNLYLNDLGGIQAKDHWTSESYARLQRWHFDMEAGRSDTTHKNQYLIFRAIRYQDIPVEEEFPNPFTLADIETDSLNKLFITEEGDTEATVHTNVTVPMLEVEGDLSVDPTAEMTFDMIFPTGWYFFSCPFNLATVTKIEYFSDPNDMLTDEPPDATQNNPATEDIFYYYKENHGFTYKQGTSNSTHISNGFTEEEFETLSLSTFFYNPVEDDKVTIIKDNDGNALLPEWDFNGIGGILKYEGYHIKSVSPFGLRVTAKAYNTTVDSNGTTLVSFESVIRLAAGWNIFCYPLSHDSEQEFPFYFEDVVSDVIIAKDYLGAAYMPGWNFNGIGTFTKFQGYQVKMAEGSSYAITFGDDGPSAAAPISVGDIFGGGYVFHIDDTGKTYVVQMVDMPGTYVWGCSGTIFSTSTAFGTGEANTSTIAGACSESPTAASVASAFTTTYDNWYLPSRDEFLKIYSTLGSGGPQGDIIDLSSGGNMYWTSSEVGDDHAYFINTGNGITNGLARTGSYKVRLIRSF
jgi:hypothetical protein